MRPGMARLLVTGGAGFIGSNFVNYWAAEHVGQRLVVLDALTYAGDLANLQSVRSSDLRFVHGSICDSVLVEKLLREEKLNTIVNFAAESHVDRSIDAPDAFIETNVVGTHALLKAARKVWIEERAVDEHRFHHVSTDEVFGSLGLGEPGFHERTAYAPNSPYSASKAASDHLVRAYHHTYGLQVTTSNCSNNYGPYQFPEKLIPLMAVNILHGRPLPVYGDGCNVRDWLHVSDHCRGIGLILQKGIAGEVYNIGAGSECTNLDLVQELCRIADEIFQDYPELLSKYPTTPSARGERTTTLIDFVRDRPGHDLRYAIDCEKIRRELGYGARVSLDSGLRETLVWYMKNEWWWRRLIDSRHPQTESRTEGSDHQSSSSWRLSAGG